MKKVLIIIKNIDGGTGTFLSQIVKLKDYEFKVCALEKPRYGTTTSGVSFFSQKPSYLASYGLNPSLYINVAREFFWLRKIVKKQKPQLILSIDTHCNVLACFLKIKNKNLKVIITNHNNVSAVIERKISKPLRSLLKLVGAYLFNRADRIVCNSNGVAGDFRRSFSIKGNISTIYYGLNLSQVRKLETKPLPIKDRNLLNGRKRKIISIGRFEEQKDFKTLIKAFKVVENEADLILIGDGSQRNELEALVSNLNIKDSVHFLGWKFNIYPYLKRSDLFVFSSNYEGFGYVLLEAISQGKPIISTDSKYGPQEVLDGGKYGTLVRGGNISELRNAILKALKENNGHKKYSDKIASRLEFFSEKNMLKSYNSLVRDLL